MSEVTNTHRSQQAYQRGRNLILLLFLSKCLLTNFQGTVLQIRHMGHDLCRHIFRFTGNASKVPSRMLGFSICCRVISLRVSLLENVTDVNGIPGWLPHSKQICHQNSLFHLFWETSFCLSILGWFFCHNIHTPLTLFHP